MPADHPTSDGRFGEDRFDPESPFEFDPSHDWDAEAAAEWAAAHPPVVLAPDGDGTWPPEVLGTFARRLGGLVLDTILLGVAFIFLYRYFYDVHTVRTDLGGGRYRLHTVRNDLPWWESVLIALPGAAVLIGTVAIWGGTPGQRLCKLRVVRRADGGPAGWARALRRWALVGVPSLVVQATGSLVSGGRVVNAIALVSGLWMLVDRNRQTLYDKVADTVVIHELGPAVGPVDAAPHHPGQDA